MARTRIRWQNVARIGACVAGAAAAVAFLPGLLSPSDPPPLPADVGLATGTSGLVYEPPKQRRDEHRGPKPEGERQPLHPHRRHAQRGDHRRAPGPDRQPPSVTDADVTSIPPVAPAPSVPVTAPAAPAPPASAPAPAPAPESASGSQVEQEFGFEP
jgi:hypothetical protein